MPPPVTYVPNPNAADGRPGGGTWCHGSPEGQIPASPGLTCIDVDSGDFYAKRTGTDATGWSNVSSGGGGNVPAAGLTQQDNDPPLDGSVTTLFFRNQLSQQKFINTGTVAIPNWEII
jgi:hypothetical protein